MQASMYACASVHILRPVQCPVCYNTVAAPCADRVIRSVHWKIMRKGSSLWQKICMCTCEHQLPCTDTAMQLKLLLMLNMKHVSALTFGRSARTPLAQIDVLIWYVQYTGHCYIYTTHWAHSSWFNVLVKHWEEVGKETAWKNICVCVCIRCLNIVWFHWSILRSFWPACMEQWCWSGIVLRTDGLFCVWQYITMRMCS